MKRNILLSLALSGISTLILSGCGGGGEASSHDSSVNGNTGSSLLPANNEVIAEHPPTLSSVENPPVVINNPPVTGGSVMKSRLEGNLSSGALKHASMTFYAVDEQANISRALVTEPAVVESDENGEFSATILDYSGAVLISATANEKTEMICFMQEGCDDANFGETFDINDSDFEINAIVASASSDVNVNILSDVASKVALESLSKNASNSTAEINNANTQVANRFGIPGDVTKIKSVDLSLVDSVISADEDTLQANILSVSIIAATLSDNTSMSFGDAIEAFGDQFLLDGGLADTERDDSHLVTLEDILHEAAQTIDLIEENSMQPITDASLNEVEAKINLEMVDAANGSTDASAGVPAKVDMVEDGVQLSKDLVSQMRTVGYTLEAEDLSDFGSDIALASEVFDGDSASVLEALVQVTSAIERAVGEYELDNSILSYSDDASGVLITISNSDGEITYSTSGAVQVGAETVNASFSANVASLNFNNVHADVVLSQVTGHFLSPNMSLSILSGSASIDIVDEFVNLFDIALEVELKENPIVNPRAIVFNGSLNVTLTNADPRNAPDANDDVFALFDSLAYQEIKLSGDGEFSSFSESVALTFSGSAEKSSESFDDITLLVRTTADLDGDINDIVITMGASRIDLEDIVTTAKFDLQSSVLEVEFDTRNSNWREDVYTATNESGILLTLTNIHSGSRPRIRGNVVYNGVEYATIDDKLGFLTVRYADGFNETLQ